MINRILKIASIFLMTVILSSSICLGNLFIVKAQYSPATEDDPFIVVSLGDSFSSGEGVEPFYGQYDKYGVENSLDEKTNNPDWLAHRSENSWAGQLTFNELPLGKKLKDFKVDEKNLDSRDPNYQWYFRASSGATTENLDNDLNKGKQSKNVKSSIFNIYTTKLANQLSVFKDYNLTGKVDYVTITIGGNDVKFTDIITKCVLEPSFLSGSYELISMLSNLWKDIDSTRAKIKQVYKNIEKYAGKQATIVVAGYPKLLSWNGTGLFNPKEADLVNNAVLKFNFVLHDIVEECQGDGMKIIFVDVEAEFDKDSGHQAYAKDENRNDSNWINPVWAFAKSQDLDQLCFASAYSMHPNNKGTEAYARCINKIMEYKYDDHEHWRECSGFKIDYDAIKYQLQNSLIYVSINGQSQFNEQECHEKLKFSTADHIYGDWMEYDKDLEYRECLVCGYIQIGLKTEHIHDDTDAGKQNQTEKDTESNPEITAEPASADQIKVKEVFNKSKVINIYDYDYTFSYSIPAVDSDEPNAVIFNQRIYDKLHGYYERTVNSDDGYIYQLSYEANVYKNIAAIRVRYTSFVPASDVGGSDIETYYYDGNNDRIIDSDAGYIEAFGYTLSQLEQAALKTKEYEELVQGGFWAGGSDYEWDSVTFIGCIFDDSTSHMIFDCVYGFYWDGTYYTNHETMIKDIATSDLLNKL